MSLRFVGQGRTVGDIPTHPNSGPKRGIGPGPGYTDQLLSTLPKPKNGPKKGHGQPPSTDSSSSLPKPILIPRPNLNTQNMNDTQVHSNRSFHPSQNESDQIIHHAIDPTIPNSGPKRGIGFGPGAIYHSKYVTPNAGPRKGIGYGPGTENMTFNNRGATPDDNLCLQLVNKFRKENGLPPVIFNSSLAAIAMPHTINMLQRKVPLGHSGFDERAKKAGMASVGENVGYCNGYSEPIKTLVDGWIHSPPHRKNLLGNFTQLGTAFAHNGNLWYGTQLFGLM